MFKNVGPTTFQTYEDVSSMFDWHERTNKGFVRFWTKSGENSKQMSMV